MLPAGIETRRILSQLDVLPLSYCHLRVSEGIFKVYIHIRLSATVELNS